MYERQYFPLLVKLNGHILYRGQPIDRDTELKLIMILNDLAMIHGLPQDEIKGV